MNSARSIEVSVNGQSLSLPDGSSVRSLLVERGLDASKVAVELNRRLLRTDHYDRRLSSGDVVEIVTFVGGG